MYLQPQWYLRKIKHIFTCTLYLKAALKWRKDEEDDESVIERDDQDRQSRIYGFNAINAALF